MTESSLNEYIIRYHKTVAEFERYMDQLNRDGKLSQEFRMDRSKINRWKNEGKYTVFHINGELKALVEYKITAS